MKIIQIGVNSFKKSLRKKVLLLLLLLSGIIIGGSHLFAFFSLEEQAKIVKDVSLASIALFGMLIAIFVASGEISSEIEAKTAHSVLAKPVSRSQFILGKFLGVIMVVTVNVVLMTIVLYISLFVKHLQPDLALWKAIYFIFMELIIISAVAIMFSSLTTTTITVTLSAFFYIAGHLVSYLEFLTNQLTTFVMKSILITLQRLLPNLENFNIRNAVVHNLPIPASLIFKTTLYCLGYTAIFLAITVLFFKKREI